MFRQPTATCIGTEVILMKATIVHRKSSQLGGSFHKRLSACVPPSHSWLYRNFTFQCFSINCLPLKLLFHFCSSSSFRLTSLPSLSPSYCTSLLPQPLKDSRFTIPKSRSSPISFYLSNDAYNDVKYPIDRDLYKKMRDEGDCLQCYVCVCVLWKERCANNWEGDVTQYI